MSMAAGYNGNMFIDANLISGGNHRVILYNPLTHSPLTVKDVGFTSNSNRKAIISSTTTSYVVKFD